MHARISGGPGWATTQVYPARIPPAVTSLSPTSGSTAGGTLVTITGTNFTGATAVDFGTTPATSLTVVNGTTLTADSPAGTGTVDVTVMTPAGTSATSSADQYTYTAAVAPTVTSLSPTSGSTAGGTLVTVTGTSFTGATAVDFGTTPATNLIVINDTTLTADSPSGTGTVNVTVTTPLGTSTTSTADQFTYTTAAAPTVVSLVRYGFHMQPTSLVLTFSTALDPASAQNVANYQIMTSGGTLIPVSSAVYNASAMTVTLSPSQLLNIHDFYQLTVNGMPPNGLTSSTGVALDGAGNGTPGTNYVTTISGQNLAGPAPELLRTDPMRFAAERRILATVDRRVSTEPNHAAVLRRRLVAAEKRMAVAASKLTAHDVTATGSSTSAVDLVLGSGLVTVKRTIARRPNGPHHSPV